MALDELDKTYSITELTREFDVSTRTLRFYEAEGLLRPIRKGRARLFRPADRTRLKLILRGKRLGFSLSEIKDFFELFKAPEGERRQLAALIDAIAERKAELEQKRRDLEETYADLQDAETLGKGAPRRIGRPVTVSLSPRDPDYETRVRNAFAGQSFMVSIGAQLDRIEPGAADIRLPRRDDLCQHHGFIHAGVTSAIADTAAGFAAASLFAADEEVLTTEFKINLLRPAKGDCLIARGRVVKPGRTLTICASDVYAENAGREHHVATALLTMIAAGPQT